MPGPTYAQADRRRGARRRSAGCGSGTGAARQSRSSVDQSPFRITVLDDGKPLVAEDADARLRYQLDLDGRAALADERDLVEGRRLPGRDRRARPHGDRHRRGDADRGADRRRAPPGDRRRSRSIDAFDTKPHEHFLGGGERGAGGRPARPDPLDRGRATAARYAPIPFFSSSAGWGLRIASQIPSALAFPGSPGGNGCQVGGQPAVQLPAAHRPRRGLPRRARLRRADLRRERSRRCSPTTRPRPEPPAVPPPSELALIKWRDVVTRPRRRARGRHAAPGRARSRSAGCSSTTRGRRATATLTFDRRPDSRPGRADPAGPRAGRAVHALGLAAGDLRRRLSGRAARQDSGRQVLDLRNPAVVAEYRRRIRALVALGVDGVKADRGDENDLARHRPRSHERLPAALRAAR